MLTRGILLGALAIVCGLAQAQAQDRARPDGSFFPAPRLNGAAVDWCARFGKDCGQAGADEFCRSQGYSGATRWERAMADRTFNIGAQTFCTKNNACGALRDVVCVGGDADRGRGRAEARDGCHWADGSDPNAPPADSGRGVLNRQAHFGYVTAATRGAVAPALTGRLEALRACSSTEDFARFYGEASVLIARAGQRVGWRDMQDPAAPADDRGRGVSDEQAHYRYALGGGAAASVPRLIGDRMRVLNAALDLQAYAQLYADLAVLTARRARGR